MFHRLSQLSSPAGQDLLASSRLSYTCDREAGRGGAAGRMQLGPLHPGPSRMTALAPTAPRVYQFSPGKERESELHLFIGSQL